MQDFTSIAFKDLLSAIFVGLESHHIASKSFQTFHTSPNHWVLTKKLSLGQWWCTEYRLQCLSCGSNYLPHSFLCLNFGNWKILTKSLETLRTWPNSSSYLKKLSLDKPPHILVLFHGMQDFTSIAFKDLLSGIFLGLESDHIPSKSFQNFHTSPNHWVLTKKLSLRQWWCTEHRLHGLSCDSNYLPQSFCCLNFGNWKILTKSFETLRTLPDWSSYLKKLSLDEPPHILVLFHGMQDFTSIAFKDLLSAIFVGLESHHIASKSFQTFHTSPNHWVLTKKLSFGQWWCTEHRFQCLSCGSNFLPHPFLCLNFGNWKILTKSLETLRTWPNSSSYLKKLSLDEPPHILVLFHGMQDFTSIAFKDLLSGIFVGLESHHIASKSFQTFHTSPNHWVLTKKLSLGQWWCTEHRLQCLSCGSNYLPHSFLCLNFGNWKILTKSLETLRTWPNWSSYLKKLSLDEPPHLLVLFHGMQDFTSIAFKDLLSGIFVGLESHHIASKSFQTFHTSPNHWVLTKKLSLGQWWCTEHRLQCLSCGSNYLPHSFWCLNFGNWKILTKSLETLRTLPNWSS